MRTAASLSSATPSSRHNHPHRVAAPVAPNNSKTPTTPRRPPARCAPLAAASTSASAMTPSSSSAIRAAAEEWLRIDPDPASRAELQALLTRLDDGGGAPPSASSSSTAAAAAALAELRDRFSGPLEFGTAGLRAKMGPGPARMNRVTVQQATQGLANYLLDETPGSGGAVLLGLGPGGSADADAVRRAGVVVGHDARHGSAHFARAAAAALALKGIRVHLFGTIVPTPFVAAAVAYLGAAAGVMVTASHNAKEYNGYKVYWSGGSQIVPPVDAGIARAIRWSAAEEGLWDLPRELLLADDAAAPPSPPQQQQQQPEKETEPLALAQQQQQQQQQLITDPAQAVLPLYYARLVRGLRFRAPEANARAQPVVYTPLHGVGLEALERAFREFGLPPPVVVAAQARPDPEFPTVVFPNPEEGAGTWDLAFAAGREAGARLVLANDPDADRLAAAERDAFAPGGYRPFSGNEIGLLLADWVWRNRGIVAGEGDRHDSAAAGGGGGGGEGEGNSKAGKTKRRQAMLASAVSSRALASVAAREGFTFEQTLTGFKWLGTIARRMVEAGKGTTGEGAAAGAAAAAAAGGGGGDKEKSEGAPPPPVVAVDEVLFAFEEAIGFMFPGTGVMDKDGVAAACAFAEMAAERYASGGGGGGEGGAVDSGQPTPSAQTLAGRLEELYARYGRFCSRSGYFVADPPSKGAAVFEEWRRTRRPGQEEEEEGGDRGRTINKNNNYPSSVGGMAVASVRDLGAGLDTARPGGRPALPWSPGDMMVTFELEDPARGLRGALTLRGSGTEPKLKYYAEVWTVGGGGGGEAGGASGAASAPAAAEAAEVAVAAVAKAVADDLVRPEERGLKRQGA